MGDKVYDGSDGGGGRGGEGSLVSVQELFTMFQRIFDPSTGQLFTPSQDSSHDLQVHIQELTQLLSEVYNEQNPGTPIDMGIPLGIQHSISNRIFKQAADKFTDYTHTYYILVGRHFDIPE